MCKSTFLNLETQDKTFQKTHWLHYATSLPLSPSTQRCRKYNLFTSVPIQHDHLWQPHPSGRTLQPNKHFAGSRISTTSYHWKHQKSPHLQPQQLAISTDTTHINKHSFHYHSLLRHWHIRIGTQLQMMARFPLSDHLNLYLPTYDDQHITQRQHDILTHSFPSWNYNTNYNAFAL